MRDCCCGLVAPRWLLPWWCGEDKAAAAAADGDRRGDAPAALAAATASATLRDDMDACSRPREPGTATRDTPAAADAAPGSASVPRTASAKMRGRRSGPPAAMTAAALLAAASMAAAAEEGVVRRVDANALVRAIHPAAPALAVAAAPAQPPRSSGTNSLFRAGRDYRMCSTILRIMGTFDQAIKATRDAEETLSLQISWPASSRATRRGSDTDEQAPPLVAYAE